MKRTVLVRPGRRRRPSEAGSLFPFLAVLVCTMGALILLLVVMAHRAQAQAARAAAVKSTRDDPPLAQEQEDVAWRIGHLRKSLETTRSQLAVARLELGHLEDHARQLRAKLAELRQALAQLDKTTTTTTDQADLAAQLRDQIARAEADLAEAERAASGRRGSYAVVPYEGPHGTRRRPIYLECRADGIVFMPEGVVVRPADLDEDLLGPDNPLAAALRAAREHLLNQGALDQAKSGEPYPLVLVRPSGVVAYHVAREALRSWDSEFGYELIGEDWTLEFPEPDPTLADVLRQAIDTARLRQRMLAEAAPRHYVRVRATGAPAPQQYTVSPSRGGVVPYGGGPAGFDDPPRRTGNASRHGRPDWPASAPPTDGTAQGPSSGSSSGSSNGSSTDPSSGASSNPLRPGTGTGSFGASGASNLSGASGPMGQGNPSGAAGSAAGQGSPAPGTPGSSGAAAPGGSRAHSMAKIRGENWALRDASPRATPLTQPIRIECHPDRVVLVAQAGRFGSRTIPLRARTEETIDDFVSAVWDYMDTWGIAGERMYWQPVLNVYVAPGAETQFADLSALLEGSGLIIERQQ